MNEYKTGFCIIIYLFHVWRYITTPLFIFVTMCPYNLYSQKPISYDFKFLISGTYVQKSETTLILVKRQLNIMYIQI